MIGYTSWPNVEENYKSTLAREFNYVTIFTTMTYLQPDRGRFTLNIRDMEAAFSREHGMKLLGAPLIWDNWYKHTDTPAWLKFATPDCGGWSKAELDEIMKTHIQTVVSHFKGAFSVWQVVNEPLKRDRDLTPGPLSQADIRDSCWYKLLGEDYIAKAFTYAHAADPQALLMMNDQFGYRGTDRLQGDKFLELVKKLKDQGVPIHVAGYQMHLQAQLLQPNFLDDFRDFLQKSASLGIQVHITEMDVYQGPPGAFPNPQQRVKEIYESILATCLQFSHCKALTVFGITDKYGSARENLPNAAALLFDESYKPKPAYFGVLDALKRK